MHVDVSDFLIWIAAGLIGWIVRELRSAVKWRRVRREAMRELEDPQGTDDPVVAVATALVREQSPRIRRESTSIVNVKGIDELK